MEQGPDELSERTMEGVNAGAPGSEDVGTGPEEDRSSQRGKPDPVDEGSEESFPASDPPSETNPAL